MDFHPAFAGMYAAEAKRLRSKYTAALTYSVEPPPVWEDPRTAEAFAWTNNNAPGFPVTFNSEQFGPSANPAKTLKGLAKMAVHHRSVELHPADVLTHEYGHVLVDHISARKQWEFARDLKKYLRPYATSERKLFSALSAYGVSDPAEAMAEAFVLMDRGADHPAARIAEKYLGHLRR